MHDDMKLHVTDDHEVSMARADLYKLAKYSMDLCKMLKHVDELEGWVQAKITKASDYISSVKHYLEFDFVEAGMPMESMDTKYKKHKKKKTMEMASSGSTSSGAIAAAPSPTGMQVRMPTAKKMKTKTKVKK